jgi:hypothetical protein
VAGYSSLMPGDDLLVEPDGGGPTLSNVHIVCSTTINSLTITAADAINGLTVTAAPGCSIGDGGIYVEAPTIAQLHVDIGGSAMNFTGGVIHPRLHPSLTF